MANISPEMIASKMVDKFNVEMDIYQISENCMEALNRMGMLKLGKKILISPIADNQSILMPPEACEIKGVLGHHHHHFREEETNSVIVSIGDIWFPPAKIFVPVPNSEPTMVETQCTDDVLNVIEQLFGPYLDFKWESPFVRLNKKHGAAIVIYTTIPIDRNTGLCEIPEQAFNGCLYFCLYTYFQPLFLMGKVQMGIWKEIEGWKNRNFNQSRQQLMMSKLSANEMSKVHNTMASMDRKRFHLDS